MKEKSLFIFRMEKGFLYSPNKRGRSFFMHVKKDEDDVRKKERNVKNRGENKKKNDSNTLRNLMFIAFLLLYVVRKIAIP